MQIITYYLVHMLLNSMIYKFIALQLSIKNFRITIRSNNYNFINENRLMILLTQLKFFLV